jgi:hypothetical protein
LENNLPGAEVNVRQTLVCRRCFDKLKLVGHPVGN